MFGWFGVAPEKRASLRDVMDGNVYAFETDNFWWLVITYNNTTREKHRRKCFLCVVSSLTERAENKRFREMEIMHIAL